MLIPNRYIFSASALPLGLIFLLTAVIISFCFAKENFFKTDGIFFVSLFNFYYFQYILQFHFKSCRELIRF